jgi:hypothetical protein
MSERLGVFTDGFAKYGHWLAAESDTNVKLKIFYLCQRRGRGRRLQARGWQLTR